MSDFSKIKANGVDHGLSDVKMRDNIALKELSGISSRSYSVGDYLIFDGVLYEVIQDINISDVLTINTNIESVKISDKLKHLEQSKMDNGGYIDQAVYAQNAGYATRATYADEAIQDGSGNTITSYYQQKIIHSVITIASSSWSQNENDTSIYETTVTVSGVTSSNNIHVSPAPDYIDCGVYAYSQSTDTLVFRCRSVPEVTVTINVEIQN